MLHWVYLTMVDYGVHGWSQFIMDDHVDYDWTWLTICHMRHSSFYSMLIGMFFNDYVTIWHSFWLT